MLLWACLLLTISEVLNNEFSADFIGDFDQYNIQYNLHNKELTAELERILKDEPERLVSMKTPNQVSYQCILPAVESKTHRKIEEYKGPSPLDLLKPLVNEREVSIFGNNGYWFYDIAHGRFIRQYHDNRETKETTEYLLGTYRQDQSVEDAKKFDQLRPPKTKINNVEYPYFPVQYRHGTPCDLTGKPRTTTLMYICYEYSRHMVHSITEVSTCKYEIAVLTNLLCSHPAFDIPTTPVHEIRCYAPEGQQYAKPSNLLDLETRASSERYDQYSMASDSTAAPHKSAVFSKLISPDNDALPKGSNNKAVRMEADKPLVDDDDATSITEKLKEVVEIYQKLQTTGMDPYPNKMSKFTKGFTDQDHQLIDDFWSGRSCFIGGQGYWSYELCYNSKVSQFHIEGGKRKQEHILGEYNIDLHKSWLNEGKNREKAFIHEDGYLKQVSNFYGNGALCEETGQKRSVEVRLRCRMPGPAETPGIVLFSLEEPETCRYVLLLESALLCEGLQLLDADGLMDPNSPSNPHISNDEETIKKIVENIKQTKQYLENFQHEFIIKDITEEFQELLGKKKQRYSDDDDEEEVEQKKKPSNAK